MSNPTNQDPAAEPVLTVRQLRLEYEVEHCVSVIQVLTTELEAILTAKACLGNAESVARRYLQREIARQAKLQMELDQLTGKRRKRHDD